VRGREVWDNGTLTINERSIHLLSSERLSDLLPPDGAWTGQGSIRFESPHGELRGPTKIEISREGDASIEMDVQDAEIPKEFGNFLGFSLGLFLDGCEPLKQGGRTTFGPPRRNRGFSGLSVDIEFGTFAATRGLVAGIEYDDRPLLRIAANDLLLTSRTTEPAAYWLLPMLGNFREHARAAGKLDHSMTLTGKVIPFGVAGRVCGLEITSPSELLTSSPFVTYDAIAFGDILGPCDDIDQLSPWFPSELLNALRFGISANIEAPWIETRTPSGSLVRRFHSRFGRRNTGEGCPAFSRFDDTSPQSGVSEFLTRFFALPEDQRCRLLAPMNLIQSGSPGNATIEETIGDLVQALDALCESAGVARQNLLSSLRADNAEAVKGITKDAIKQMAALGSTDRRKGELRDLPVLQRVAGRLANVANDERDFGLAVTQLLNKHGLLDADVMNGYYATLPSCDTTWEGLLSAVRGTVLHAGGFRTMSRTDLRKWFDFSRHLHDICKRVILSALGYKGTYAASNANYVGTYRVDRVNQQTTVQELGYSDPPTGI
jgi:hypothetical protein